MISNHDLSASKSAFCKAVSRVSSVYPD